MGGARRGSARGRCTSTSRTRAASPITSGSGPARSTPSPSTTTAPRPASSASVGRTAAPTLTRRLPSPHRQTLSIERRGSDAPPLLLRAAQRLEGLDAELARETYLEALVAAIYAGRLSTGARAADVPSAARSAPLGPEPLPARQLLPLGLASRLTEGYAAAAPTVTRP